MEAAPILYRSVLRLASYPYLLEPVKILTFDAFRTAITLLCRRPLWASSRDQDVSDFWFERVDRKRRRLLFQSLMDRFTTMQYIARTEKDDEDLNDVLYVLEQDDYAVWNADTSNDPDDPVSSSPTRLPSSNSGELSGTIPRYEFRSWLRLVVLFRLDPMGDVHWRRELEAVTDSVLECFSEHDTEQSRNDISWQVFDKSITNALVRSITSKLNNVAKLFSLFCISVSHKCSTLFSNSLAPPQAHFRCQDFRIYSHLLAK